MLEVQAIGPLATVQDRGRPGYAHLGVPHSGALDQPALERANRLVGNSLDRAGLELSQGRFVGVFHRDVLAAVTGAAALIRVNGQIMRGGAFTVHRGQRLEIGAPTAGVHCYLAVRGGIDVPAVLGSRSADTLSGLGPPPLQVGTRLSFGVCDGVPFSAGPEPEHGDTIELRIRFGPRESWFRSPEELTWNAYQMGMANRIGARLNCAGVAERGARSRRGAGAGRRETDHLSR